MFVLNNAWKTVIRNKGRNILIVLIVAIIAAAATIGLAIRNAADGPFTRRTSSCPWMLRARLSTVRRRRLPPN